MAKPAPYLKSITIGYIFTDDNFLSKYILDSIVFSVGHEVILLSLRPDHNGFDSSAHEATSGNQIPKLKRLVINLDFK